MFAQAAGMRTKLYSSMCSWVAGKPKALLAVAGWLALAAAGWAASSSELLEQGIYAEETKGDLDAATNAYRQAIAEARPGWAAAAQAQFRLGVCCYRKKDFPSGAAAFDQVIKGYPEQKELLAQANDYLYRALPLLPAPWVDGEELQFVIKAAGALRAKLEADPHDPRFIRTIRDIGYRFEPEDADVQGASGK
jgi:tetratricopeptide (TPR) repeat protein